MLNEKLACGLSDRLNPILNGLKHTRVHKGFRSDKQSLPLPTNRGLHYKWWSRNDFLPWCFASQWILIDLLGSFLEYPQRILVRRFLMPFLRNRCTSWSWSLFAMHRQIWWNSCHYVLSIYSTWPPLFIGLTLIYTKAVNSP